MAHSLVVGLWYFNTPPETNIAPENGWLEYYFPFGAWPIFRCELLVLGRVHVAFSEMSGDSLSWNGWVLCHVASPCCQVFSIASNYFSVDQLEQVVPSKACFQFSRISHLRSWYSLDIFISSPPKICRAPKGKYRMCNYIVVQPLFFRGHVKLRGVVVWFML